MLESRCCKVVMWASGLSVSSVHNMVTLSLEGWHRLNTLSIKKQQTETKGAIGGTVNNRITFQAQPLSWPEKGKGVHGDHHGQTIGYGVEGRA